MMRRRFHGRSHDENLDSAGRIRIPKHLIEHAGLDEGPCVVIGVGDTSRSGTPRPGPTHDAEIDETAPEMRRSSRTAAPAPPAETRGYGPRWPH